MNTATNKPKQITVSAPARVIHCISVWQPWASLLVTGIKRFETRCWPTNHHGPVLLQAAKMRSAEGERCWHENQLHEREAFSRRGYATFHSLPFGSIVGVVSLAGSKTTEELLDAGIVGGPDDLEFRLGDFSPDRYGWQCANPVCFDEPIPMRGRQRFWTLRANEVPSLAKQLG